MAKQEQEQLVEIFVKLAKIHATLMMYYDNLATDRMEYDENEITEEFVADAQEELNELERFLSEAGFSFQDLLEQYGEE